MDSQTLMLFGSCLAYATFCFWLNTKIDNKSLWWLESLTMILGLFAFGGVGYLLTVSFLSYIEI